MNIRTLNLVTSLLLALACAHPGLATTPLKPDPAQRARDLYVMIQCRAEQDPVGLVLTSRHARLARVQDANWALFTQVLEQVRPGAQARRPGPHHLDFLVGRPGPGDGWLGVLTLQNGHGSSLPAPLTGLLEPRATLAMSWECLPEALDEAAQTTLAEAIHMALLLATGPETSAVSYVALSQPPGVIAFNREVMRLAGMHDLHGSAADASRQGQWYGGLTLVPEPTPVKRERGERPPQSAAAADLPERGAFTPLAAEVLNQWATRHLHDPYPEPQTRIELARQGGLAPDQVDRWFVNFRRRRWERLAKNKGLTLVSRQAALNPQTLGLPAAKAGSRPAPPAAVAGQKRTRSGTARPAQAKPSDSEPDRGPKAE